MLDSAFEFFGLTGPHAIAHDILLVVVLALMIGYGMRMLDAVQRRVSGYKVSQKQKQAVLKEALIERYSQKPELLPLLTARLSHQEFLVLFFLLALVAMWISDTYSPGEIDLIRPYRHLAFIALATLTVLCLRNAIERAKLTFQVMVGVELRLLPLGEMPSMNWLEKVMSKI